MFTVSKEQKLQVAACNLVKLCSHDHLRNYWGLLKCKRKILLNGFGSSKKKQQQQKSKVMTMTLRNSVMCHVSGTFQKEGKDFPGKGNLARDNYTSGINSLCSCSKMSRLFQRMAIWSQLGGIFYLHTKIWLTRWTVSNLNCNGKTLAYHIFCTLLKYKQLFLATLSARAPT